MLKADQQQFVQSTNSQLLDIRNMEVSYFIAFFSNFGTQCALISGFLLNAISQVPGLEAACPLFFKYLYWIATACSLCFSMHVLLCTVFINVYGQGLALRGPLGSMVRAVKGMVAETNQILGAYVMTIIFFTFSTIGVYWIMMPVDAAIVSSIITVLGMGMWYHFVLRIFNRFQWSSTAETTWNENENVDPAAYLREKDLTEPNNDTKGPDNVNSDGSNSTFSNFFGRKTDKAAAADAVAAEKKKSGTTAIGFSFGGYISVKVIKLFQERWERRYAVVVGSQLYYYSDKKSFELKPEKTLRKRPIDLEVFTLDLVENSTDESAQYILRLTPTAEEEDRKQIELQCDTVKETQQWIDALVIGIKIGSNAADMEKNNLDKSSGRSVRGSGSVRGDAADGGGDDDDTRSMTSRSSPRSGGAGGGSLASQQQRHN